MKKNKSIFKCWKLVWHIKIGFFIGVQNQKNEKNVEKAQKNCKILQDQPLNEKVTASTY